jgi:hypothetical protein
MDPLEEYASFVNDYLVCYIKGNRGKLRIDDKGNMIVSDICLIRDRYQLTNELITFAGLADVLMVTGIMRRVSDQGFYIEVDNVKEG